MRQIATESQKMLRHQQATQRSFERKLAFMLTLMGMALGLNILLVHLNHDASVRSWEPPQHLLIGQ
jgi:hypothetical protein